MKRLILILATTAALACAQDKPQASDVNVELTVYLLSGSAQGTDDVPQDLIATVKQLHSVFAYKSYKLTESFVLRGRSNNTGFNRGASTEGILPGSGLRYRFGYSKLWVTGDPPRSVHIDLLNLNLDRAPITTKDGKQRTDRVATINTDLDIRDGQKTVVGKSSFDGAGDALILVIVPKIVD
jgi:hypothetical protein